MFASKKRSNRKWKQLTSRQHILHLEHLYQSREETIVRDRLSLQHIMERAVRTGQTVHVRLKQLDTVSGSIQAIFHDRGTIELVTSTGMRRMVRAADVIDIEWKIT